LKGNLLMKNKKPIRIAPLDSGSPVSAAVN
jgi:hypothetical protein